MTVLHNFLIDIVRPTTEGKCRMTTYRVAAPDASQAMEKFFDSGTVVYEGEETDVIVVGMELDQGNVYD